MKYLDARGKGEWDYDVKNDILLFKIKGRKYVKSVEFNDLVLDLDNEDFVTGIQIFDASEILKIDKHSFKNIHHWEFHVKIENEIARVQLMFDILNAKMKERRGQDLIRESPGLNDSEVVCVV
ncbi:DUF2283 domain-containing protein [Candidatus Woesearchaeota archaeon]|nr:DUF2283 domain-containing protein [Candidatus Woesearchaeota archaeon]